MSERKIAERRANWASGTFESVPPNTITQFEKRMRELRLTTENCSRSEKLRGWCKENCHRCYIPEWLLKIWGFSGDSEYS
jgi:hypothetical protein